MNTKKVFQIVTLAWICMLGLTACDPQVYGSVGVSSGEGSAELTVIQRLRFHSTGRLR
jgi:hypothetical protein